MTEDYKEQLLNYITGNLENTSPTLDEIFKEIFEVDRSNWLNYMPSSWDDMRVEGLIESITNGNIILYGGYIKDNVTKGFIILLDSNFNPIQYFENFDSGTSLRYIQCMSQDNDGTFFFIDDEYFTPNENSNVLTSEKRFVMINNFTVPINDTYRISLATSYILGNDYKNFYCKNIQKNPNSSHYAMIGVSFIQDTNRFLGIKEIELIINVGTSNQWKYIQTPFTTGYYQEYNFILKK